MKCVVTCQTSYWVVCFTELSSRFHHSLVFGRCLVRNTCRGYLLNSLNLLLMLSFSIVRVFVRESWTDCIIPSWYVGSCWSLLCRLLLLLPLVGVLTAVWPGPTESPTRRRRPEFPWGRGPSTTKRRQRRMAILPVDTHAEFYLACTRACNSKIWTLTHSLLSVPCGTTWIHCKVNISPFTNNAAISAFLYFYKSWVSL